MEAKRLLLGLSGAGLLLALTLFAALVALAGAPPAGGRAQAPANPTGAALAGGLLTPTPSPTACVLAYTYTVSSGTVYTGTDLVPGSQCLGCIVPLTLPFPVTFYGQTYTTANVASSGNLQFVTADPSRQSCPPPYPQLGPALMPYWNDGFDLSWNYPCQMAYGLPCGIFTALSGSAPNRTFVVNWRARDAASNHETVNYEIRFHENSAIIDFVYGLGVQFGYFTTIGVQDGAGQYTGYICNVPGNYQYLTIQWQPVYGPPCQPSPTPTGTLMPSPTPTPVATGTPLSGTPTPTSVATSTIPPSPMGTPPPATATRAPLATATPPPATATATACAIAFTDVHPADYFYEPVRYLYCHGVISGYGDGTFRPYNNTTRGQMVKIAVNGFGFPIWTPVPAATPTFRDVLRSDPFFAYVETAAHSGIVSGYADGTFHPNAAVGRGQLAKIVVVAAGIANGWPLLDPPVATFADVPRGSAFYSYVETAVCHGILSGYGDGTFRPGAGATRGQIAKIEYLAILNQGTCAGPRAPNQPGN